MYKIIDTHSHILASQFGFEQHEILQRAWEAGVRRILVVCTELEEAKRALALAKEYDWLDVACGFHPTELMELTERDLVGLEALLQEPKVVALGEIGLDYHWKEVPKAMQKEWFIKQMQLANRYDKPILIHMRDATADTLALLKEYCQTDGIMHCFTGSVETAHEVIKLGLNISLAGPLTFKNANHLLDVAKAVPIEKLFVETDAPYLTPHPLRGQRNEPAYVTYTFDKVCELKGIEKATASEIMWDHYHHMFLKGKSE